MTIHHGDLFDVLPTLDAESIDACVTDPPYGIGFIGKEWDTFKPGYRKDGWDYSRDAKGSDALHAADYDRSLTGLRGFQAWTEQWGREVYRVLKPGAYIFICGGPRSFHRMTSGVEDAGFEIRDCLSWLYGSGFPKSLNLPEGRGTALKPSWEPIVLARKPIVGTVAANAQRHGTGALNIDACRIGDEERTYDLTMVAGGFETTGGGRNVKSGEKTVTGRWPANVCLDEDAAAMLDEQSGISEQCGRTLTRGERASDNKYGRFLNQQGTTYAIPADSGGASRFYYVAKPSREERDYGTDGLTARQRDESRKDGNPGGDNPRNRGLQPRGNFHPTVKPVELMRWLVRLVTPVDGVVLDPFTGSGTTGMAARYEQRRFIGIEREADYVQIAERRISAVTPLFGDAPMTAKQSERV